MHLQRLSELFGDAHDRSTVGPRPDLRDLLLAGCWPEAQRGTGLARTSGWRTSICGCSTGRTRAHSDAGFTRTFGPIDRDDRGKAQDVRISDRAYSSTSGCRREAGPGHWCVCADGGQRHLGRRWGMLRTGRVLLTPSDGHPRADHEQGWWARKIIILPCRARSSPWLRGRQRRGLPASSPS